LPRISLSLSSGRPLRAGPVGFIRATLASSRTPAARAGCRRNRRTRGLGGGSGLRGPSGTLRRIVVEALLDDPLAAPELEGKLVEREGPALVIDELEHPIDHRAIAFDHEASHRPGADRAMPLDDTPFAADQSRAAAARRIEVLLHRRILVIKC